MEWRFRLEQVKLVTIRRPYIFSFLAILALYFGFNVYANQFSETIPVFLSFNLWFVIPYFVLSVLIGMTIAVNLNLIIYQMKNVLSMKKEGGMTALGIFGGLLGGACPGCFVGVLPTVAGAFGVTLTLSALPLKGFGIQGLTLVILLITLLFLTRRNVCKVKIEVEK